MNCIATRVPYQQTSYFSKIVNSYLDQSPSLRAFYRHDVSMEGMAAAIEQRKAFATDRQLLRTELEQQYKDISTHDKVTDNIQLLASDTTFTICTAHQPGLFTGNLYFIYKIIHTIKLAGELNRQMPAYKFVPVFYMGSEDADLDELGHIHLNGQKLAWETSQSGAVGRMHTKGIEKLIQQVEGQLGVYPFGKELAGLLRQCYLGSTNIQEATFKLVNALFAEYGLIVLIPDNANLKKVMKPVFAQDLLEQVPSALVSRSVDALDSAGYKVQAHPREINLFYLRDNLRERIIQNGSGYKVNASDMRFTAEELQRALEQQPEVFSPNVILRGLFQETILPNIAFIGGGGELAYWLELKGLFEHYQVPFPVLVLRNSFLVIEAEWKKKMQKMGLSEYDIFLNERELLNRLVKKQSTNQLTIDEQAAAAKELYGQLRAIAKSIDITLEPHVNALETAALQKIQALEKKLLRAEKRKFADQQRQIGSIRQALFPNDSLQERVDNFLPYYAKWGKDFFRMIYDQSGALQEGFTVITVNEG